MKIDQTIPPHTPEAGRLGRGIRL